MRHFSLSLLAGGLVVLLACGMASATLLGLERTHYPLVYTPDITISYDPNGATSGNGLLTIEGWPVLLQWSYDPNDPNNEEALADLSVGSLFLRLEINPETGAFVSGSQNLLDVTGDPNEDYTEEVLFHSTTPTAFGFGQEDQFEFLFTQEEGVLAPAGEPVGMTVFGTSISEFHEPIFTIAFSNDGDGDGSTFYLPEPATMAFLALGGLSLASRRRRVRL